MKFVSNKSKKFILISLVFLLTAIISLTGLGIYFKFMPTKEKLLSQKNLSPNFPIDTWDGTVEGANFNENYAGRGDFTKTINSAESFVHFVNEVNNGNSFSFYKIYLNTSIDLGGQQISPIGTKHHPFKGTFDGGYFTIYNAKVDGNGLFGYTQNATIKNVGLYNGSTNLIDTAINTNIENTYVRLGDGNLANEFISNTGNHHIINSFVDSSANGMLTKASANNSSENEITIKNCYFTQGETPIAEKTESDYVKYDNVIKVSNKSDFSNWDYSSTFSHSTDWCDYSCSDESSKLDFVYPIQSGFAKTFLTGSYYESVMISGNNIIDSTNFQSAFNEADKFEDAKINLLVEKILMESSAEVSKAKITITTVKDTTIVRGDNNNESMFIASGTSQIIIGNHQNTLNGSIDNQPAITLDGNRDFVETNNLESGALVVSYGGQVEINNNVKIKNNINNTIGYGGAILMYDAADSVNINATIENCSSSKGGGAIAVVSNQEEVHLNLGSFKNCQTTGSGGALYLSNNLPSETIQALSSTFGTKHLITPLEETIIDTRWELTEDSTIDEPLTFQGCSTVSGGGGAIYCSGTLTISANVTFNENETTSSHGGAINATSIVISEGVTASFEGNFARQGGAINGDITIYGETTFTSNTAYSYGGAIYGTTTIDGTSTFSNNSSTSSSGGAIHGVTKINGTATFSNNQASSSGGAISGTTIINEGATATFENNTTNSFAGGAIYGGTITISGSANFTSNSSTLSYGGAVVATTKITISGEATFLNNTAQSMGGAIEAKEVSISEAGTATFEGNSSQSSGAIQSNTITISGTATFTGNKATASSNTGGGGAISAIESITINGEATFSNNTARFGGAISGTTTINGNATFENNSTSGSTGGAIYGDITINGQTTFISNTASSSGGAISGTTIINEGATATFENNTTNSYAGGAIYGGTITISGSANFTSNSSTLSYGGAVVATTKIIISGEATFVNNTAQSAGGAIDAKEVSISEAGTATFEGNSSQSSGAIQSNTITISGTATFTGNKATASSNTGGGGAISASESITINGEATFSNNTARFGGAITGTTTINGNATFENNSTSGSNGGAIYGDTTINEGAIANFENNTSNRQGGAINGTTEINGEAIFKNNSTETYGGAIYGTTTINGEATFTANTSKSNGGAIYGNITINEGATAIFEDNYAAHGALHSSSEGSINIAGSATFVNNTAVSGGAICSYGTLIITGEVTLNDNCTIYGNTNVGEIDFNGTSFILGSDLNVLTDSGIKPISLGENSHITLTKELSSALTIIKSNAAVYNNDNKSSYIFEDATTDGLGNVSSSHPFIVANAPTGSTVNFNVLKEHFGVLGQAFVITWKNEDGTVLETDNDVVQSSIPTYDGPIPTKVPTNQYTYAFNGWSPEIQPVAGSTTYTATFVKTLRTYTITWKNEDGTTLETDENVPYGTTPTYNGATPTKNSTAAETYTFIGWEPLVETVTSDASYTVVFSKQPREYTITWGNYDGSVLSTSSVAYGNTPAYSGSTPIKASTGQYSYTFIGWTPEIQPVTGDATYTAVYEQVLSVFTITWENYDGSVLSTSSATYGSTPTYSGATPTKASTAQYYYTFKGWSPEITPAIEDTTYTATYNEILHHYTITWKNYDGSTLTTTRATYGATPTYVGATPTKASTAQYSYTFKGWSPEITQATRDATYRATYTETLRSYTITWKNYDGYVLETDLNIPYGETPKYDGETPTKASTTQYSYTFNGWSPEITAVIGAATYTATYTPILRSYTITWENDDGYVLETDLNIPYGETPTYDSETPTKASTDQYSYTFNGWAPEITSVIGEATYTATYTATLRSYTITWKNYDGSILSTTNVTYGSTPAYSGATPTKESTAQYSYTFKGWAPEITPVTGATTYTATYTQAITTYTIIWKNDDGYVLETDLNIPYGETPKYDGETPTKASTAQYSYTFNGWSPEITAVIGATTYTATYTASPISYTITYDLNYEDKIYTEIPYNYGDFITLPAQPTRANFKFGGWYFDKAFTDELTSTDTMPASNKTVYAQWINNAFTLTVNLNYPGSPNYTKSVQAGTKITLDRPTRNGHSFSGWYYDNTLTNPVLEDDLMPEYDIEVYAHWTINTYTITWKNDDGSVLETDNNVAYNAMPTYNGQTPTKEPSEQYTYTFNGWNPTVSSVTGDATYTATYTQSLRTYTITWKNDDGSVLETDNNVAYNAMPTYNGATPTKEPSEQYTYTFNGWNPTVSSVTGDATYTATYTQTLRTYTVIWKNDNGTILETDKNVPYGAAPTYDGETPTKEPSEQYTYTFNGWNPTVSSVTGDVTYTATYTQTLRTYTITWKNDNGTILETDKNVPYGATPSYDGETPTKEPTAQYSFVFTGWNPALNIVTSDRTYIATYSSSVETYTITWLNDNGSVLETDNNVAYNAMPTYNGATPTKEPSEQYTYTFNGWNPTVSSVTGDATYTATYTQALRTYTITWKNDDGSILIAGEVEYGRLPVYTGTTPTKESTEQFTFAFTGWSPELTIVTGEACYTALYTNALRSYTITWTNDNGDVLQGPKNLEYGTTPTYSGATPTKAETAQYIYVFAGWSPSVSIVTSNQTYVATYLSKLKTYDVVWKNYDGTILETDEDVAYGVLPTYNRENPSKPQTSQYNFTFSGWTPEVTPVSGDAVYTATYAENIRSYTVNISSIGNGSVSPEGTYVYEYGHTLTISINPTEGFVIKRITVNNQVLMINYEDILKNGLIIETIDKDYIIVVEFTSNIYSIRVSVEGNGFVTQVSTNVQIPIYAEVIVTHGKNEFFKFTPEIGYRIKTIKVDGVSLSGQTLETAKNSGLSFENVKEDHTLTVVYEINRYTISVKVIEGKGNLSCDNDLTQVAHGDDRNLSINTDFNYYNVEIYINGNLVYNVREELILTNITEDMYIEVKFVKKAFIDTPIGLFVIISSIVLTCTLFVTIFIVIRVRRNKRARLI